MVSGGRTPEAEAAKIIRLVSGGIRFSRYKYSQLFAPLADEEMGFGQGGRRKMLFREGNSSGIELLPEG